MTIANALAYQVGAVVALRYGGKGIRPLLVAVSLGLSIKLLVQSHPFWSEWFGTVFGG